MNNKNNSHVFYYKPSVWFGRIFAIACFVQVHFFQHKKGFIFTEIWGITAIFLLLILSPRLKINEHGVFFSTLFGLINYKKMLSSDIKNVLLKEQIKAVLQPVKEFRLLLRSKREERIEIKLSHYLNTEEIVNLLRNKYGFSQRYQKNEIQENAYEVKTLILGGIAYGLCIILLYLWVSVSMKHINTAEVFFWHNSLWFLCFFVFSVIFTSYALSKFLNGNFRDERANLGVLAIVNLIFLPLFIIPTIVEIYNEKTVNESTFHKFALIENQYKQIWISKDFSNANTKFSISGFKNKTLYNSKLEKGKTYLLPVYKGKYKDYFLPKDAFLKAKQVNE